MTPYEQYPPDSAYWRLYPHNRVRVDYGLGGWILAGKVGEAVEAMTMEIVALRAQAAALRAGRSLHRWPAFGIALTTTPTGGGDAR